MSNDKIEVPHSAHPRSDASIGELVAGISDQMTRLVRDELRLAQLDMSAKAKRAGLGAGLFGGAGLFAAYGVAALLAAAIIALAGPLPAWLAAVLVGVALLLVAGVSALVGKREVSQATPPVPTEAVEGLKQDARSLTHGGSDD